MVHQDFEDIILAGNFYPPAGLLDVYAIELPNDPEVVEGNGELLTDKSNDCLASLLRFRRD